MTVCEYAGQVMGDSNMHLLERCSCQQLNLPVWAWSLQPPVEVSRHQVHQAVKYAQDYVDVFPVAPKSSWHGSWECKSQLLLQHFVSRYKSACMHYDLELEHSAGAGQYDIGDMFAGNEAIPLAAIPQRSATRLPTELPSGASRLQPVLDSNLLDPDNRHGTRRRRWSHL